MKNIEYVTHPKHVIVVMKLMLSDNFLTIVFVYPILVAKILCDLIIASIAEFVDGELKSHGLNGQIVII